MQSMLMAHQEQILASLAAMPVEYVKKLEKDREKKRKEWKYLQNQKQQWKAQEEKIKSTLKGLCNLQERKYVLQ
jgi:hypothetical protein